MKKIVCILFLCSMIFSLCSCNDSSTQNTNEFATMKTHLSKDYVSEFMELLGGEVECDGLLSGFVLDEEHCFNVTPPEVAAETDMKIFKFSDSCASFVLLDNNIYELCTSFGGYGFVNAVPCDFDNDNNIDLLVASSWGSGMHRSIISIFNSVTKESTILFDSSKTENPNVDLFISTSSPSFTSKELDELPICYTVYAAKIIIDDTENYNLADLSYVTTDFIGVIDVEDGTPVFKPYKE